MGFSHVTVYHIILLSNLTCEVLKVNIADRGTKLDARALRDGQRLNCD